MSRKTLLRIVAPVAVLVAADVLVTVFATGDGIFRRLPLPPFRSFTHPLQVEWARTLHEEERGQGIGRFDAELGWSWEPSTASPDGMFHVNSIGARGTREYAPSPPEGVTRIVCFGDSFTFCDDVSDKKTFQVSLETRHRELEVLNFGVSGYGTDQALLRYRRLGRDLGAEVVCIGILTENVGRNVNRYRPLWNPTSGFCAAKPRFLLEGNELVLLPQPFATRDELWRALEDDSVVERVADGEHWIGPSVPTGRLSSFGRLAAGYFAYRARQESRLWRDTDGEPFRVTVALLEAFHREALADGARLAPVLIFPTLEGFLEYLRTGEMHWDMLHAELDRRGVPWIDFTEAFAREQRAYSAGEHEHLVYVGGHLSWYGNRIVADELHAWLHRR